MKLKAISFKKTGYALLFLAIFFIAFGSHLLHPFFPQHKTGHNHYADRSAHHLQITPIESSERCPICMFLASGQLDGKMPVMAMALQPPFAETVTQYNLLPSQKTCYRLFSSRAPPFPSS